MRDFQIEALLISLRLETTAHKPLSRNPYPETPEQKSLYARSMNLSLESPITVFP
jgi:hypothetical protein